MPRGATDAASRSNQRSIELYPIATGASSTSASCQGDAIVGRRLQVGGGLLDRVQSQKDTPPGSKCVSPPELARAVWVTGRAQVSHDDKPAPL